ncbi:hypothetical protein OG264_36540 [Streptomyces xanthophaeus]|uniref:hypothetical protein n=1 Tax=Streptomyces xanthophaeus TaxID=67385 RepID=UPI003869BBC8|nr:hypothetical protein OG264_36540 [Streptomyces xanthophaeus]WST58477.1 hypothetical protein OG605_01895 [Streptomyces xanthophaeus]
MTDDEDRILADALGAVGAIGGGSGGRTGATFAAKRLKKNVHEVPLTLAAPLDAAAQHVAGVLARLGNLLGTGGGAEPDAQRTVRAVVGGGFGNMNPVVVTVTLTAAGPQGTAVCVRGAAKEGLIKQRAGEKTARQVAALLAGPQH